LIIFIFLLNTYGRFIFIAAELHRWSVIFLVGTFF
jgi:hypothetical protein